MAFTDKTLRCVDCGREYTWTAGEQAFFAEKHLQHEPRRCRACKARHEERLSALRERDEKVVADAICALCGRPTTVPFRPTPGRPVLCRDCYHRRRTRGGLSS
jgi:CxxC-x17-CxxC domain-containing protein